MRVIAFLVVAGLLLLALFPVYYCINKLVRDRRNWKWWILATLLVTLGSYAGASFINTERENATRTRKYPGLPLPYVMFAWEEDHWTDFIFPTPTVFTIVGFDFCAGLGLAMTPLALALRRINRSNPVRAVDGTQA
jgi:hypothetical protein